MTSIILSNIEKCIIKYNILILKNNINDSKVTSYIIFVVNFWLRTLFFWCKNILRFI